MKIIEMKGKKVKLLNPYHTTDGFIIPKGTTGIIKVNDIYIENVFYHYMQFDEIIYYSNNKGHKMMIVGWEIKDNDLEIINEN